MKSPKLKRMAYFILTLLLLSSLLVLAAYVENWSRDLTTNVAWTDPASADATLRPLITEQPPEKLVEAAHAFANRVPNWSVPQTDTPTDLPADSPLNQLTSDPPLAVLHLVHTTSLARWQDDVWVVIDQHEQGREVFLHSQSRVGKGDLGQNPRNIRELLGALKEATN